MIFYPEERIAIFIDGANLYSAARGLAFDIDYKRLLDLFSTKGRLIRAFYYTALVEDQEYSPIRPLVDWLDYNGYSMVTKPTKEFTDAMGRRRIKGNMDIELAIDMLEMAQYIDHAILFSGDGDFRRLVEAVQRRGVRVSVVSTIRSSPPMVSDDLRRQADNFIELQDLAPNIIAQSPCRATRWRGRAPNPSTRRERRRRAVPSRAPMRPAALPPRDCPLCPRLAAFRAGAARGAPGMVQRAGAALWRRRGRAADRRPGAGTAAAPTAPAGRLPAIMPASLLYATLRKFGSPRGTMTPAPMTVWRSPARASPTRCAACRRRTSPKPREIAACRPFSRGRDRRDAAAARDPGARRHRPRRGAGRTGAAPRAVPLRAWRVARAAGRHAAGRQLSLLAAQHQHRQADRGDVRSGVRGPVGQLARTARGRTPSGAPRKAMRTAHGSAAKPPAFCDCICNAAPGDIATCSHSQDRWEFSMRRLARAVALLVLRIAAVARARADVPSYPIALKNNQFVPSEIADPSRGQGQARRSQRQPDHVRIRKHPVPSREGRRARPARSPCSSGRSIPAAMSSSTIFTRRPAAI